MKAKDIIGQAARINLPDLGVDNVHARVDTGAKTCAIWASTIVRKDDNTLEVIFFGQDSPHYTGRAIQFKDFSETVVASSNGEAEHRYKIKLTVTVQGRTIYASFTLADRAHQSYPVLLGRNILRNKFIVDVSIGDVHTESEKKRSVQLQEILNSKAKI